MASSVLLSLSLSLSLLPVSAAAGEIQIVDLSGISGNLHRVRRRLAHTHARSPPHPLTPNSTLPAGPRNRVIPQMVQENRLRWRPGLQSLHAPAFSTERQRSMPEAECSMSTVGMYRQPPTRCLTAIPGARAQMQIGCATLMGLPTPSTGQCQSHCFCSGV